MLFKFLARSVFHILGGLLIGFSLPFGSPFISRNMDLLILLPLGIVLLATSFYYTFIDDKH